MDKQYFLAQGNKEKTIAGYEVFNCCIDNKIMTGYQKGGGDIAFIFSSGWSVPFPLADMFEIADKLSESNRCVIFDRFGYGFSDFANNTRSIAKITQETKQLCDAISINKNVVFIGHSLATFHALDFASTYPDICKGIILIDCYPAQNIFERMTFLIHWLPLYFFRLIKKLNILQKAGKFMYKKLFLSGCNVPDDIKDAALWAIKRIAFNNDMKSELKEFRTDIKRLFSVLDIQVRVKVASICRNATYSVNKKFVRKIPHIIIVNTGKGSHLVHNKYPDVIVSEAQKIAQSIIDKK